MLQPPAIRWAERQLHAVIPQKNRPTYRVLSIYLRPNRLRFHVRQHRQHRGHTVRTRLLQGGEGLVPKKRCLFPAPKLAMRIVTLHPPLTYRAKVQSSSKPTAHQSAFAVQTRQCVKAHIGVTPPDFLSDLPGQLDEDPSNHIVTQP